MRSPTVPRVRVAMQSGVSTGLITIAVAIASGLASGNRPATAQDADPKAKAADKAAPPAPKVKLGVVVDDPKALQGYTLLNTINSKNVYLLDHAGRVVHSWKPETNTSHCCYLLPDGNLLRPAELGGREKAFGGGPAPSAGSRNSPGMASWSGTSRTSTTSSSPTTTSARCPTATS